MTFGIYFYFWMPKWFAFVRGHLSVGGCRFHGEVKPGELFRLMATNFLIVIFTLGLGIGLGAHAHHALLRLPPRPGEPVAPGNRPARGPLQGRRRRRGAGRRHGHGRGPWILKRRREPPIRPSIDSVYWEGPALLFDGLSARARETRVAIGPGGLDIRDGESAGRYLRDDLALVEKSGDGGYFSLSLKTRAGHVLEFRDAAALEWLRASGLLARPALAGLSLRGKAALLILVLAAFSASCTSWAWI